MFRKIVIGAGSFVGIALIILSFLDRDVPTAPSGPEEVRSGQLQLDTVPLGALTLVPNGVVAGNIAGQLISFNAKGIDFAMTALFIVILLDQLQTKANRIPALIGLCSAIVGLLVYPANMLIPSIVVGLIALLALRSRLESAMPATEGGADHA